jgi:hypothetical protein
VARICHRLEHLPVACYKWFAHIVLDYSYAVLRYVEDCAIHLTRKKELQGIARKYCVQDLLTK